MIKMFRSAASSFKKDGKAYELKNLIELGNGYINNQSDSVLI